jgi:hypothetical protein
MADPLSATASIVGIAVPALHGIRLLLNDLERIKEAPKTIQRLRDDVRAVEGILDLIQGIDNREWIQLGTAIAGQSEKTIDSCKQACEVFRTDLQRWTNHSNNGTLAWQDRTVVGFFKKDQIKAIAEQLQNCKLTIGNVVSIATL